MTDSAVVEIDHLSFGYDSARPVLHDINLRMPRGKLIGIMGQSGCGKTTLLRILSLKSVVMFG